MKYYGVSESRHGSHVKEFELRETAKFLIHDESGSKFKKLMVKVILLQIQDIQTGHVPDMKYTGSIMKSHSRLLKIINAQ